MVRTFHAIAVLGYLTPGIHTARRVPAIAEDDEEAQLRELQASLAM